MRKLSLLVASACLAVVASASAESVFRFQLQAPILLGSGGGGDNGGGDGGGPPDAGGNTDLPVILTPDLPALVELSSSFAALLSSQGGAEPYVFSVLDILPPGIVKSGSTLSGTFDEVDIYDFTVGVVDAAGEDGSRTFRVEVMEPLALGYGESAFVARVGTPVSIPAPTVTGARDGYTVKVASGNLPDGVSPATDGAITLASGVPGAGTVGLRAEDGLDRHSPVQTLSWSVVPQIAISGFASATTLDFGSTYISAAPVAGNTVGDVTWSVSGTLPSGLTVNPETGVISGTVQPDAVAVSGLRYVVSDSLGSAPSATFGFTVQNSVIATVGGNQQNASIASFFSAEDWGSSVPKRLVIPEGVVIGSTATSTPALTAGAGMGGSLTVENHGSIQGKGGNPGSVGGPAFNALVTVRIENYGDILAGGGGGGKGGNGGTGGNVTNYGSWSAYKSSGVLNNETYCRRTSSGTTYRWDGSGFSPGVVQNGYIYECNTVPYYDSWPNQSFAVRRRTVTVVPQAGTTGGNGGMGMGFGTVTRAGAQAVAAINGAGTGGTGGTGGDWGQSGSRGADGAAGTSGAKGPGSAGTNGVASGAAIVNASRVTLVNMGGRVLGPTTN